MWCSCGQFCFVSLSSPQQACTCLLTVCRVVRVLVLHILALFLNVLGCVLFEATVLFRECIGYPRQVVCWAQSSSVSPAQCRIAIQQALAIWTRVADHLRWHLGSLLAYRWMFHSSCRWSGPGPSPTSRCISRNQTEHLKSGLPLKQVLEGVLSSNSFVLMQLQKGKRYFCLAIHGFYGISDWQSGSVELKLNFYVFAHVACKCWQLCHMDSTARQATATHVTYRYKRCTDSNMHSCNNTQIIHNVTPNAAIRILMEF